MKKIKVFPAPTAVMKKACIFSNEKLGCQASNEIKMACFHLEISLGAEVGFYEAIEENLSIVEKFTGKPIPEELFYESEPVVANPILN